MADEQQTGINWKKGINSETDPEKAVFLVF